MHPFQRGEFHGFPEFPGAAPMDQLRFVQTVDGLSQGAVIAVAFAAHRRLYARLGQFDELRKLLSRLGFEEHIRDSQHLYRKSGVEDMINLQKDGSKAKPYQVKQVRAVILKHNLGDQTDV